MREGSAESGRAASRRLVPAPAAVVAPAAKKHDDENNDQQRRRVHIALPRHALRAEDCARVAGRESSDEASRNNEAAN